MKFSRHARAVFGLLAASLLAGPALAWGPQGHEVIATVARDRLAATNPAAANRIYMILKADGLFHQYQLKDKKTGKMRTVTCGAKTIAQLANWPDCVRKSPQYSYTASYHFDDVARCNPAGTWPARNSYCAQGKCGSSALQRYVAALKNPNTSPRKRAEALSFVVHIAGDLHQPMHAVDNGNDRGGNEVAISFAPEVGNHSRTDNLHSLWDGDLVRNALGDAPSAISRVGSMAQAGSAPAAVLDPDSWVRKAHEFAEFAYSKLTEAPACKAGETNGGLVTQAYLDESRTIIEGQITSGAIDLAAILNDALGS